MIADNKDFFNTPVLKMIMEQMGWTLNKEKTLLEELEMAFASSGFKWNKEVLPVRPDFYPNGTILAHSKKYMIVSDGYSEIEYKGWIFNSPDELLVSQGAEGIIDIKNWNIKVEKEWIIKTNTRHPTWTDYSFSKLNDCPFKSTVR